MSIPQTEALNETAILAGAHMLKATSERPILPDNFSTLSERDQVIALINAWLAVDWKNCGALDDGKFSGENKSSKREIQNIADKTIVTDQTGKYTAKMYELMNPVIEPILASGLSSFTNIPGSPVSNEAFIVPAGFEFGKAYKLPFKNADGSKPIIGSVTGATDGTIALNEDYIIQNLGAGEYSIVFIDSALITTNAQAMTIVGSYTPTAMRVVGTGGKTEVGYIAIMIVCKNEKGQYVRWIVPKCTSTKGFEYAAKKYNDDKKLIGFDVEINAELETSYPAGYQLYFRLDEVNV